MVVRTTDTAGQRAILSDTALADATEIQVGAGGAKADASAVANLFSSVGIATDKIKSASSTDDLNSLIVENYTGQDIADLADGLNIEVQVGGTSSVTLTSANLGAVETVSIAATKSASLSAEQFGLLAAAGASFGGEGSILITNYSDDALGSDAGNSEASEDIVLGTHLTSSLNVTVEVDTGDTADFNSLNFTNFGSGDVLVINGTLTAGADSLLDLVAAGVELRGSGTLKLADYGYDKLPLSSLLTAANAADNTLKLDLTTSGDFTLTKDNLVGASGDLARIQKITVPTGSTVNLTADLATTTVATGELFTQRFAEQSGGSGTIKVSGLGSTHNLSGFVADDSTDDLTVEVVSTQSSVALTDAKLDKVDSINVSASAVASVSQSELSDFTTAGRTLSGTAGVPEVSETSILTVTSADGTVVLPSLTNLNVDVEMAGDVTLDGGNFDAANKISMTTNNTFHVQSGADLAVTEIDLKANGSSMIFDVGALPSKLNMIGASTADKAVITLDKNFAAGDFIEVSIDNGPTLLVSVVGADTAAANIKAALEADSTYSGVFDVASSVVDSSTDALTITSVLGRAFTVTAQKVNGSGSVTVENDSRTVDFSTTADSSVTADTSNQFINLSSVDLVGGIDQVNIKLDDGNDTYASTGHVRLSSALSQNSKVTLTLDDTSNSTVEDIFIEVSDRYSSSGQLISGVTGTLISSAVLSGNTTATSDNWEDHGMGMFRIENFQMGSDTLNFVDSSGIAKFNSANFSDYATTGVGDGDFVMTKQKTDLDSITAVRAKIAGIVTSADANSEFAITLFGQDANNKWEVGVFSVKWNSSDSTSNLQNVAAMEVTPMAKITEINTSDWSDFFTSPSAIPNDNLVTRPQLLS